MKEQFIKFLEENEALDAFVENLEAIRIIPITLDDFIESVDFTESFISAAFIWCCSPEEDGYWRDLNIEWKSLI